MKKRQYSSSGSSTASFVSAPDLPITRAPTTLTRVVSPPPSVRTNTDFKADKGKSRVVSIRQPTTAEVEAGIEDVDDHVAFFSAKLASFTHPPSSSPQLAHAEWLDLYRRNQTSNGHHFVVHQHDHPIAGTHYDLRLQINATSSISFAIMYGLPGDPNSRRLNRNATETRVHCVWQHLLETASKQTGTLLIWDTGEYEVLEKTPVATRNASSDTDRDSDSDDTFQSSFAALSEPEKLASAFSYRKIRLRLHGTRLPAGYTLYLRLTKENDRSTQPRAPAFKRRRRTQDPGPETHHHRSASTPSDTSSGSSPKAMSMAASSPDGSPSASDSGTDNTTATRNSTHRSLRYSVSTLNRTTSPPRNSSKKSTQFHQPSPPTAPGPAPKEETSESSKPASLLLQPHPPAPSLPINPNPNLHSQTKPIINDDNDDDHEEETIRLNNAYPGALNSVNSIHQRKWYLSLDRTLSGFVPIQNPKPTPTPTQSALKSGGSHHRYGKTWWVPISSGSNPSVLPTSSGRVDGEGNENPLGGNEKEKETKNRQLRNARGARGFQRFHVLGRDHERSVVTGRLARDVLEDEGVEGYVPRGLWRAVVE